MVELRVAQLTPTALAAGQVSTAPQQQLANAAGVMQDTANTFSEFYENEARINRELILANAQADWARTMTERAPEAGAGFAESIKKEYSEYVAEAMKGAPERGRDNLELAFTKYGIDLETRALQAEAAARARAKAEAKAAARKARGEALRLQANSLISDPAQLEEMMEADPENADYYVKVANDARMMNDPETVYQEMQAGKWDAYLSPSEKLSFMKGGAAAVERAQREAEIALQVEQKTYEEALNEEMAYAEANGAPPVDSVFTPEAVAALYPEPEQRAEIERIYTQSIADAEMVYGVRTASPDVLQAQAEEIAALISKPGYTAEDVARANAFRSAIEARDQAIVTDAPSYAIGISDETSVRYDAYSSAAPEDRPVAARGYVAAVDATYDRLGIPQEFRAVLPKQQAIAVVTEFNQMAPDVAAQAMLDYVGEWGESAPRVVEQLRKEGLAPEYSVALRHVGNPGLASAIVSLRGQDVASLKVGIPTASVSDAEAVLVEKLTDFRAVFEAGDVTGAALKTFNDNYGVAERLMIQSLRSGMDPTEAANQVVKQLFPETPLKTSEMQVLVPERFNPDKVERGLEEAMMEDALRAFDPAPLDDPRLPEFADAEVMIAAAQDGVWLNNSTGDGAVLHLNIGGYLLPVVGRDGRLYDVKFSAAATRQTTVKAPRATGQQP